jgi:flagellar biosynthesis/type III secretory pathway protein FliH
LHLSQISSVIQLRPTLDYLDNLDAKVKEADMRINAHERKENDMEDEGKAVQVDSSNKDHYTNGRSRGREQGYNAAAAETNG